MQRARLAVVCFTILLLALGVSANPKKKHISVADKTKVAGTLMSVNEKKGEVEVKAPSGETLKRSVNRKGLRALQHVGSGKEVLLFEREKDGNRVVTDECWRIGNSACGGSQNDPCGSAEERRIYYKCVDEDGNESYYDDCEPDGCITKSKTRMIVNKAT